MSQTENKLNDIFLAKIIFNESKGIISDLACQPKLMIPFMEVTEDEYDNCLSYISKIMITCFRNGELKVLINCTGERLNGYAVFFDHPDTSFSRYCHKIFVFEEFRKQGIGSKILIDLLEESKNLTLLCSPDLIPFYEKAGMTFVGYKEIPESTDGFEFTRDMYHGLAVMNGPEVSGPSPVFMLNDNDIKKILSFIGKTSAVLAQT
ncbi:N-acetyltransferase [Pectobacterium parmentieri]|uniref:GNAT family N-acetyltransferase n=1 Tax=Pectobacterium parmentieri TaxID=1905730 RepID=UPI000EB4CF87|nr:GNAT family N-acetyltransferase [Pectobacterium parmentieri]AYH27247.1 N-acetyltransferase [Pectobacterium parmentieri]